MKRGVVYCVAWLLCAMPAKADERDAIARIFHADPQYLVLNIPPRPDVWPGAIFTANLRIPIVHGDATDPSLHLGEPVAINSSDGFDLTAGSNAGIANFFGLSTDAGAVANIVMSFPDAQVVDMSLDDLQKHISTSHVTVDAAKSGQIPLIVIKSYVGTPVITITRKANASAEGWAKFRNNVSVGAKAAAEAGDTVTMTAARKFVFAFETSQVSFNLADLAQNKISPTLATLPSTLFASRDDSTTNRFAVVVKETTGLSLDEYLANESGYRRLLPNVCATAGAC